VPKADAVLAATGSTTCRRSRRARSSRRSRSGALPASTRSRSRSSRARCFRTVVRAVARPRSRSTLARRSRARSFAGASTTATRATSTRCSPRAPVARSPPAPPRRTARRRRRPPGLPLSARLARTATRWTRLRGSTPSSSLFHSTSHYPVAFTLLLSLNSHDRFEQLSPLAIKAVLDARILTSIIRAPKRTVLIQNLDLDQPHACRYKMMQGG
jgi:hypothetical protein